MPSEVICDASTCGGCRYLEQDEWPANLAEFLANCQHAKCKVVRLVRQQISKLQNMQYEALLTARDEMPKKTYNKTSNKMQDMLKKMRNGTSSEIQDMLGNDVHEVHGEVYNEPDDDLRKMRKKTYNETSNKMQDMLEEMRNGTSSEIQDMLRNDVHGVHGEVYNESDDDLKEAKVEHAFSESHGKLYGVQKIVASTRRTVGVANTIGDAETASLRRAASPGRAVNRKWLLRILDRVRHRAHLILAAVAVGVIVWTALLYGVFLGATACGNGPTCSWLSSKYTQDRRILF